MNHAITATCATGSRQAVVHAIAVVSKGAARPADVRSRGESLYEGAAGRSIWPESKFSNLRQIREEGERYDPDRESDEDDEVNAGLTETAWATKNLQDAQRLMDDAINLLGVLLDALEQDGDSRAAQARTVLEMAVESLHKAHRLVDEHEGQDLDRFEADVDQADPEEDQPAREY